MTLARPVAWLAGMIVAGTLFVVATRDKLPQKFPGDFLCFWTAGKLLRAGQSPYDPTLQKDVQAALGWEKDKEGMGIWDYLPYFYPPWFGLLFVPLVPLGFATAKAIWLALNIELLFLTGYLLRKAVPGVSPYIPMATVPLFAFSISAVLFGQVVVLVLFLIASAWRLLDSRWDRAAGAVLAWVTIKPQLAVLVVPAVLLWAVRRRRWGVAYGAVGMFLLLCLVSTVLVPRWPQAMVQAIRETPLPSDARPWFSSTWSCWLRLFAIHGALFWTLYLALVVPLLVVLARAALDPAGPVRDVLAVSLLASFFLASYARLYDFPVLLVTFFVLLGDRLSQAVGAVVLLIVLILPYVHIISFPLDAPAQGYLFWVPLLLAILWLGSSLLRRQAPA